MNKKPARLLHGDCVERMKELPENSVDAIVTDPPYGLGFCEHAWDAATPGVEMWREALRVLKPGGHLLAFAGARTQHRMAVAIEDAGFEIRDMYAWIYGGGMPKAGDLSKAIDALDRLDAQREKRLKFTAWMRSQGVTAAQLNTVTRSQMGSHYLTDKSQPAVPVAEHFDAIRTLLSSEPPAWVLELVAERTSESENTKRRAVTGERQANKVDYNPGASVVERVTIQQTRAYTPEAKKWQGFSTNVKPAMEPITLARKPIAHSSVARNVLAHGVGALNIEATKTESGRWPAAVLHDDSQEVLEIFPAQARGYFYCSKASKRDRSEGLDGGRNTHPTVKPTDLMLHLVTLVTPPGGRVLDPFMGSGSTGKAAVRGGFEFIGIELDPDYLEIARKRITHEMESSADE